MQTEMQILAELRQSDSARLIAAAAVKAGRDPYRELGFPEVPLTVSTAGLIFDLLDPRDESEKSDSDLDIEAAATMEEMDAQDAWDAATGEDEEQQGYGGLRGAALPAEVRRLAQPRLTRNRKRRRRGRKNRVLSKTVDSVAPGPYHLRVTSI